MSSVLRVSVGGRFSNASPHREEVPSRKARKTCISRPAASSGRSEATISDTTATPSKALQEVDTAP